MTTNKPIATHHAKVIGASNAQEREDVEPERTAGQLLMDAARTGNIARVREILDARGGALADTDLGNGVRYAAGFGQLDCLALLFPLCPASTPAPYRVHAMLWAAEGNHLECLRFLMAAGCDPREPSYRNTP